jgi:hypothetical protein
MKNSTGTYKAHHKYRGNFFTVELGKEDVELGTCPVVEPSGASHRGVRTNQSGNWVVTFMSRLNL